MLPMPVVTQFEDQLETVALDADEEVKRRRRAAFQYGVIVLSRLQLNAEARSRISKGLNMLQLSAKLGDIEARGIVGWLHRALSSYLHEDSTEAVEISWLEEAVLRGSSTARRHLYTLDRGAYQRVLEEFRNNRAGLGFELPYSWYYPDFLFLCAIKDVVEDYDRLLPLLLCFSTRGNIRLMEALTDLNIDVNMETDRNETALFCACCSGHAAMVRLLLRKGADPSRQTREGLTPLHFLSAFTDTDIQDIAGLLVRNNAPLEARATPEATNYRFSIDFPYGILPGTPLAWAVAAGSIAATTALMQLGADAFDRKGVNLPVDHQWSSTVHISPVMYAATMHQWQLLEILLPAKPSWLSVLLDFFMIEYGWTLNNSSRPIGPWGDIEDSTAIECCVMYAADGLLSRLLQHGEAHEIAFKKTFELLVSRGCDPSISATKRTRVLAKAITFGQPFVLRFLLEWRGGCLKPSPEVWAAFVLNTITSSDAAMFQALMEYEQIDQVPQNLWSEFLEKAAVTDNIDFLEPFKIYLDPASDYTAHLKKALSLGNFATSRWFHSNARCNIAQFDAIQQRTLLGTLLQDSKYAVNRSMVVKKYLDLLPNPEEVFAHVDEISGGSFTALHLASFFPQYSKNAVMATDVLDSVLEKFHESRHLNC